MMSTVFLMMGRNLQKKLLRCQMMSIMRHNTSSSGSASLLRATTLSCIQSACRPLWPNHVHASGDQLVVDVGESQLLSRGSCTFVSGCTAWRSVKQILRSGVGWIENKGITFAILIGI